MYYRYWALLLMAGRGCVDGSQEVLATADLRATQTEEKLKQDKVKGKNNANKTHFDAAN
jgi:hypothetical protein